MNRCSLPPTFPAVVDRTGDYYVVLKPNGELGIIPVIIAGAIAIAAIGTAIGIDAVMAHRAKKKTEKAEKASDADFAKMMQEYDNEEAAIRALVPKPQPPPSSWAVPAAVVVGALAVAWSALEGSK